MIFDSELAKAGIKFGEPRIVMTRFGERYLRTSTTLVGGEFWNLWNAKKAELKAAGYGCGKDEYNGGGWQVTHWAQTMSVAEREAAAAASRATDAAIVVPKPAGLTDDYLPFQRAGIAYASKRAGTLIADEPGLGKTIQAIGVANLMDPAPRKILVVPPATLLSNWRNEINKWQVLGLPVHVIRPNSVFRGQADGWYVINFDIVHKFEDVLKGTDWDLAIYDEAHVLKTKTARRTLILLGGQKKDRKTKKITKFEPVKAKRCLMLTGTPILNRPKEIYTLLHSLDPQRWGSWSGFTRKYCAGCETDFGWDPNGASNLDELNARLRETVMVRRLKHEVLTELPPKRRQVVPMDWEGDARAAAAVARELEVYEKGEAAVAAASAQAQRAEAEGDAAAYAAAVRAMEDAGQIAFTEMSLVRHETAVAKIPYVLEHLRNIEPGTKLVVFAHHKDVVKAIAEGMADRGVVTITGETKVADRDPIVKRFQTDPRTEIFVGNIKAAGVGITLTASSHVVFAELDWVPGNVSQAEDRCHRIGQIDTVLVQHIVLNESLDAKMAKTLVEKQKVIDAALDKKVASTEKEVPITVVAEAGALKEAPKEVKSFDAKRAALDAAAAKLTPEQIAAIHQALRTVAAYDADRARDLNGMGFSKLDTMFGNDLAAQPSLRPRQAAAAMKMVRKYKRQYDERLYAVIFGQQEEVLAG